MREKLQEIYDLLYLRFGAQNWWPGDTRLEVAVGAILTQNTNWGNVEKAIRNLKSSGSLKAVRLQQMPEDELASLIRPAGYYNIKARRLRNFINLLVAAYGGSMKRMVKVAGMHMRKELLSVNGIGPETADSILLYALDKPVFVIDAYTKRVLSRHNIIHRDEDYDAVQRLFHDNLEEDRQFFNEYHALLVRVAKEFCRPEPHCTGCPLEKV